MLKKLVVLLLLLSKISLSQNESNHWIFGNRAGVNFNTMTATGPHPLSTTEGVATISDASGNLLFFTDGTSIWNRLGVIMPNGTGLLGSSSTTQSAVILKMIGSTDRYYVFTAPDCSSGNPVAYSIVDMSLAGGFGDVTIKNVPLYTPSTEKCLVVKHCNGIDAWLITHDTGSNTFRVFPITAAGVGLPILSSVGTNVGGNMISQIGYLKSSKQGHKLSICHYGLNIAQVLDFNSSTGVVSNAITTSNTANVGPYGTEFSPDGRLVYYSYNNGARILQYNLCTNTSTNIVTNIGTSGALQEKNGAIYVSLLNRAFLSKIPNPNVPGVPGFVLNDIPLVAGTNPTFGFPNFAQNYTSTYIPAIQYSQNCEVFNFTAPPTTCSALAISFSWDFGDGTNSNLANPTHTYSSTGTYTVTLTMNYPCNSVSSSIFVTVSSVTSQPINTNQ